MLSKCANPRCSAQFSYLHQGKLFRWDTAATTPGNGGAFADEREMSMSAHHVEFFWLCDDCCAAMTLSFNRNTGVQINPLKRPAGGVAAAAAASSS